MSDIAFYYDAEKNKAGAFIPGVPTAHLTQKQFEAFSPIQQASIVASPFYVAFEMDLSSDVDDEEE